MTSLDFSHLKSLVHWMWPKMVGAQVQNVWSNEEILVLEIYLKKNMWLVFDLSMGNPLLLLLNSKPPVAKKNKPVVGFLNAHGKNLRLVDFKMDAAMGRIADFIFAGGERDCEITFVGIPRSVNLLVSAGDKKISWNKVRDLGTSSSEEKEVSQDWQSWCDSWVDFRFGKKSIGANKKVVSFDRVIEKKQKAILALQESLQSTDVDLYRELGELLKYSKDVPGHLKKFFNNKLSVAQNREACFAKAKSLEKKKEGTLKRIELLQTEIEKLKNAPAISEASSASSGVASAIMQKSDARGRKLKLDDDLEAVMGKSGVDNLAILRKARAWDYWLHLRDYPGVHAILFRNKNQSVAQSAFDQIGQWLIKESIKKPVSGVKYEVLVAECRFVKPIKGAKPGLVTYQNTRVFKVASI